MDVTMVFLGVFGRLIVGVVDPKKTDERFVVLRRAHELENVRFLPEIALEGPDERVRFHQLLPCKELLTVSRDTLSFLIPCNSRAWETFFSSFLRKEEKRD